METRHKETLSKIIDLSTKFGADQTDAIISKGDSFSLHSQNAEIDKYKVSGTQVIGIRVIKDSKVGISYTESFDSNSLELTAKSAVENAQNSEPNEFEKISSVSGEHLFKTPFKKDISSTKEKIDFCLELEKKIKEKDPRVQTIPYNALSEVQSSRYYLNSSNLFCFSSEYYLSCHTSALLTDADKSSMHYHGSIARSLNDLDVNQCVNESLEHASQWLKASSLKTGFYDIIFTLDSFSEIMDCFSNIFSAKGAMEKTNPFSEKLKKKVAGSSITITDIPQYKDAFFSNHFDSEGTPRQNLTLIEDGVLQAFYHNTATARFFKTKTTGHASRGAKSSLTISGTTRVIKKGAISATDITSGEYFEIHTLQGLHSGANSISGDFSFAASGYLCRDGQRVLPIKGVTVSGNFHKMLLDISIVGDTLHSSFDKSFFAPKLRFQNMSVAGT